ncbi:MAG: DUF3122 domain-containing protein [Oscillatoria sp. Prado101]|nr:DUF3122 domain-containing protein [Oscillatoria sp. Prado101]
MLICGLILWLFLGLGNPYPAVAAVSQMEEAPGQILVRSRHTLQDETGKSWQVVLFKRLKAGEGESLNLRLVGFPGVAEFSHPQPLEITAAKGEALTAADRFAAGAPAANVGEWDLLEILPQLPKNSPVRLSLPLGQNQSLKMRVPLPVVLEWQDIATRKY